jgi:hypothetical protein
MTRRGGALPAALLTLLLLGALASLALAAGRLRARSGDQSLALARARAAALSGLARAEAQWDPVFAAGIPVGAVVALPWSGAPPVDGVTSHDSLHRLGAHLYLARSIGELRTAQGHLLAREGVGRLLRLEHPAVPDSAAAFAGGAVLLLADNGVDGGDQVPTAWDTVCPPPDTGGVGLLFGGPAPTLGCPGGTCVLGQPALAADSGLTRGFLSRLPGGGWTTLTNQADHHLPAGTLVPAPLSAGGTCDRTQGGNWGDPSDPAAPCGAYLPVVSVGAPFALQGGSGQGVLLAAGDLEFLGTARFAGVILARGQVVLRDQSRVEGVVLAEGGLLVEGTARLARSGCAVRRALRAGVRPLRPVPRGFWRWP